jgi:hypothetical protein
MDVALVEIDQQPRAMSSQRDIISYFETTISVFYLELEHFSVALCLRLHEDKLLDLFPFNNGAVIDIFKLLHFLVIYQYHIFFCLIGLVLYFWSD